MLLDAVIGIWEQSLLSLKQRRVEPILIARIGYGLHIPRTDQSRAHRGVRIRLGPILMMLLHCAGLPACLPACSTVSSPSLPPPAPSLLCILPFSSKFPLYRLREQFNPRQANSASSEIDIRAKASPCWSSLSKTDRNSRGYRGSTKIVWTTTKFHR